MNYLEKEILQIIEEVYKHKYVGELKVTKWEKEEERIDGTTEKFGGYNLILGLNNPEIHPIVISASLDEKGFLDFVREELKSRLLISTKYYTGVKIYPEDECNEERGTCRQNKYSNS